MPKNAAGIAVVMGSKDVFTKAKRSTVMATIRGHGNKATELRMVALFRAHGITGWRRHARVFGKPDFVFRAGRIAVFVDGCFWHGCPRHGTMPAGNRAFWMAKLTRNAARDREVNRTLRKTGWRVVRVWECDLAKIALWPRVVRRLMRAMGRLAGADAGALRIYRGKTVPVSGGGLRGCRR